MIIGISGHDGCGKSTLARMLADRTDGRIVSFADPLRHEAAGHLGLPIGALYEKPTPDDMRAYLRALGWIRRSRCGADYWVRKWGETVAELHDRFHIFTDDQRHMNEALFIEKNNGVLVSLERSKVEPDRVREFMPIITEVWDTRRLVQASGGRHLYLNTDELTPEQTADAVMAHFGLVAS